MQFNQNDTICAISTPHGQGGIAVIRISGPEAVSVGDSIWHGKPLAKATSHTAHLGNITDTLGKHLDQTVATIFRAPASFTGEDVVELSVHGSKYIQRELLNTLIAKGARLALPGEFTRRAFLNGKLDLAQAEAVADIIAADSRAAHRIAASQMKGRFSQKLNQLRQQLVDLAALIELELDFSEEDVEFASREHLRETASTILDQVTHMRDSFNAGHAIKEGIPVAIIGPTNAGKSSLLNAIVGDNRAIVSDIHGTTRDTIEETINLGDYTFRFIDTAGLRHTDDTIEQIGIQRALDTIDRANIIIALISPDTELPESILRTVKHISDSALQQHIIIALNKIDKYPDADVPAQLAVLLSALPDQATSLRISANDGTGLDNLRQAIVNIANRQAGAAQEDIIVTNARHAEALANAALSARQIIDGLDAGLPPDLIAQDMRLTIHHLATITGEIPSTEILNTIFTRFCIGK